VVELKPFPASTLDAATTVAPPHLVARTLWDPSALAFGRARGLAARLLGEKSLSTIDCQRIGWLVERSPGPRPLGRPPLSYLLF
jgi:hypothetical protein